MRMARLRGDGTSYYHIVSRVIQKQMLLDDVEKERFRKLMPTLGDGMTFLLTGHFWMHLGQLSAWRRACGMPPLF